MLEFKKIVKWFGNRGALNGLDFIVEKNEIHGYIGHNGAGKTTSFLIANKLLEPTFGDVLILGKNINQLTSHEMLKVSLLTDKLNWYRELTVEELFKFGCGIYGKKYKDILRSDSIQLFHPEPWLKKPLKKLSTGMNKKVSIMMCLISEPALVFLDEPFSGLDPIAIADISGLIQQLREIKNMTFVISSHNLPEMEAICDRVTIIRSGYNVASGALEELYRNYGLSRSFSLSYQSSSQLYSTKAADESELYNLMNKIHAENGRLISVTENKIGLSDLYQKIHS